MELKNKHIFLAAVFCLFSLFLFAQYPPEPRMDGGVPGQGPPCADQVDDGDSSTQPPPPGLCLSINTYIYPLLLLGIVFGAYRIIKVENAKKTNGE